MDICSRYMKLYNILEKRHSELSTNRRLEPIKITSPFKGRYLILKILCESTKPLTLEEISNITGRSITISREYTNKLLKDGFIKK